MQNNLVSNDKTNKPFGKCWAQQLLPDFVQISTSSAYFHPTTIKWGVGDFHHNCVYLTLPYVTPLFVGALSSFTMAGFKRQSYGLDKVKQYPMFPSYRLVILCLLLFSAFITNVNFYTLNFAITCMVNATYLNETQNMASNNLTSGPTCDSQENASKHDMWVISLIFSSKILWSRCSEHYFSC